MKDLCDENRLYKVQQDKLENIILIKMSHK